jgi:hypothetical protein
MTVLSENPVVLSENSCAGRVVRELECAHAQARMPTSQSIPGPGSAASVCRSHTGSPAAAAKRASITFSRLPSRTQLAARRFRR